jgi:hypothetical protein
MNAGRDVERLIANWLAEEAPGRAPDRVLAAAGTRIDRTNQRRYAALRDLPIPWRPKTMFERLAVAAVVAVVAIGALTLGASLLLGPSGPAAGACPKEFSEAEALDTSVEGLTQAQRAWGIAGGSPGSVRPGRIAAFAWDGDPANNPLTVITIDPATGVRCRLLSFVGIRGVFGPNFTQLDWSPSGDALALGVETPGSTGASYPDGQLLIWTPSRLFRVWSGPGQIPGFEWAPDGRSIAVSGPIGADPINARIIFADGSPDRIFDVKLVAEYLKWSPDGSRWIVAELNGDIAKSDTGTSVATVDLADGHLTPIDLGINHLIPKGWFDNGRAILLDRGGNRYLDVPVDDPERFSVVPVPEDAFHINGFVAFSPDRRRVAYLASAGGVDIADVAGGSSSTPVHIDTGGAGIVGLAWAPDGSQLVLTTWPPSAEWSDGPVRTWVVNADGTDLRQISPGIVWTLGDPWQPVPVR